MSRPGDRPGSGNGRDRESCVELALFDLDGTITNRDTFAGFLKFIKGRPRFYAGVACLIPVVAGFFLGLIPAWRAKELMSMFFFRGMDADELERLGVRYSREKLPGIVRPQALERIEWHKAQGHTIIVVSASIDLWIKEWCRSRGAGLIATKLEVKGGRITGRFLTRNCSGKEKVKRIEAEVDLARFDRIYAYGDSSGDRAMLGLADERYYRWKRI